MAGRAKEAFIGLSLVVGVAALVVVSITLANPDLLTGQGFKDKGEEGAPPSSSGSLDGKLALNTLLLIGCFFTVISFATPLVVYWSSGSDIHVTQSFFTKTDIFSAGFGTLAWLIYSIVQLHGEDGRIIGTAAVITNSFGFAFLALFLAIKVCAHRPVSQSVCNIGFLAFLVVCGGIFYLAIFGPIKRNSPPACYLSFVACLLQFVSVLLPFIGVYYLLTLPEDHNNVEVIPNKRKLAIYFRAIDFVVTMFWALYCVHTYEHDYFEMANAVGAFFSFATLYIYLVFALKPR